jgi:hypothetical protein
MKFHDLGAGRKNIVENRNLVGLDIVCEYTFGDVLVIPDLKRSYRIVRFPRRNK